MDPTGQLPASEARAPAGIDWAGLLRRHDRWLRTAVSARLGEPEGVEEVMQAVAVAAIEQRSPLVDASKAAGWLYRLAMWQTLLYRRGAGRRRKLAGRYGQRRAAEQEGAAPKDPLAWLMSDERRQLVRAALQQLSRKDAEILLLKYTEDWSYRELAEHLGVSESAVQARLHRARTRLREELARLDIPEHD